MLEFLNNAGYSNTSKYQNLLNQTKSIHAKIKQLSDTDLKRQTGKLKEKLSDGYTLNEILPEAFATAKEATKRILGLEMFDVQVLGGIVLHTGEVAEMKTGEGKTIVSILPAYLNCLQEPGVNIVTVNDYLAKRDAELVGKVYKFLSLTVGLIQQNMNIHERRKNYSCDIIYVTNSELGFDYLRDNMAIESMNVTQNSFWYAIIDEVDSILIDEARTPLIISGPSESKTEKYSQSTELADQLKKSIHYDIDEKNRNAVLTDTGIVFCEKFLNSKNLYSIKDPWAQYITNAIKAKELFLKNRHYIVKYSEVIIVDEFTGRIMSGRRWSDGLHQAVESKEGLPVQQENRTLASITYQNLFLLYNKLSGMTGTAKTEEAELDKIYNLKVVSIPTNKPCIRREFFDLVYKTEFSKWQAVTQECFTMHKIGRPVLVGTTNIEKSEMLSKMLEAYNIKHNLLNAKPENVNREAEIIAQAGRKYALTISTNMAGRGTDIVLGGNAKFIAKLIFANIIKSILRNNSNLDSNKQIMNTYLPDVLKTINKNIEEVKNILLSSSIHSKNIDKYLAEAINSENSDNDQLEKTTMKNLYLKILDKYNKIFSVEKQEVIELGGLHVIGTERHESRRIDNQLRGRAGRQGDPGSSRFFLSLDDNLLRIFGGDKIKILMQNLKIDDNTPIESTILSKSLDGAQKKVESYFYDIRKQLFEYDAVINTQRQAIYSEREKILGAYFMRDCIIEYGESTINEIIDCNQNDKKNYKNNLMKICTIFNLPSAIDIIQCENLDKSELKIFLYEQLHTAYDLKEAYLEQLKPGLIRQLEKYYLLEQIDQAWQKHMEKMALLRDSINWRSYGQQDPLIEYKNEAFSLFLNMTSYIRQAVIYLIMRSKLIMNLQ